MKGKNKTNPNYYRYQHMYEKEKTFLLFSSGYASDNPKYVLLTVQKQGHPMLLQHPSDALLNPSAEQNIRGGKKHPVALDSDRLQSSRHLCS